MRTNVNLLWVLTAFFVVATAGYMLWSISYFGYIEVIGTAVIGFLIFLTSFIAFYLQSGIKKGAFLPEDRDDGEISEGAGEYGFFAPWSWWPFFLSAAIAVAFVGLAAGWWVFYLAVPFALVGLVGWVYEYSRGHFAH